jgi:broad specificity phosphatase PhoE
MRLRECDYGDLTRSPAALIESVRIQHVSKTFPNGESYEAVSRRVAAFLNDLPPCDALIIGHRATWYSLEHLLNGVPLEQAVSRPFTWQPGWTYSCDILKS